VYRAGTAFTPHGGKPRALRTAWFLGAPFHRTIALCSNSKPLFDKAGTGARAVIANSRWWRARSKPISTIGTRIHVVYNGVPPFHVTPSAREDLRWKLDLAERDFVLLFAGSGWERKGLRFAIEVEPGRCFKPNPARGRKWQRSGPPPPLRASRTTGDIPQLLSAVDAFLHRHFTNRSRTRVWGCSRRPAGDYDTTQWVCDIEQGVHGEIVEDPRDGASIARR
jgi:UDP-glucose:(heptosyl)LPS alpha-1,3-glucosyltransferase